VQRFSLYDPTQEEELNMSRIRIKTVAIAASRQVCLLSIVVLLAAGVCFGGPSISLSRKSGPPTSKLSVSGSGFKAYAEIDIYFDTKDEAKVIANGSGKFSKISIESPHLALPGKHWVSAVQRAGDTGAQAPFLVNTNWSQFGFTSNGERANPYENVLNASTVGGLGLLWSYATNSGYGGPVQTSPSVADGVVYVGSDNPGGLNEDYAVNASDGSLVWEVPYGYAVPSSMAFANGLVYFGTDNGVLYALNASNGSDWICEPPGSGYSSPAVTDGVVYAGAGGGVNAVNAITCAVLWNYMTGGTVASSPAVANGVVYIGSGDNNLYALNANTGTLMWSYTTGGAVASSPAVANGVVYVGSDDNKVYALNASTGALLWSYTTGAAVEARPAIANEVVYIGSTDNHLYGLNASTGKLLWSYVTGGAVESSPAVANGVVYIGSDDNKVYALSASTGALLWSYTTGGSVKSSPAVANGVVYVGSDDSNVYAFGLTGGARTKGVSAEQEAASTRPDLRTLRPDFNLRVSEPVAVGGDAD
jgi:outer membrane protein assembly factor BamB